MSSNSIIPLSELKKDLSVKCRLLGKSLEFKTTWGLFSPEGIDAGTEILLNAIEEIHKNSPIKDDADILDLGCGYGPIGVALGTYSTKGIIHMIDKDFVAVEYANKNAALNKVPNAEAYLSNGFSAIPSYTKYDIIVSNLPAKISKEFFWILFGEAHQFLKPGGHFVVVTIAGLEFFIKKNFEKIFGNYELLKDGKGYFVARAIKE